MLRNWLGDAPLGLDNFFARHPRAWLTFRMGVIASWEHFFCFFGTWILKSEELAAVSDPVMLDLMRWHGAEEVEHRTVAFDAYRALAGNGLKAYVGRQAAMAVAFPLMIVIWLQAAAHVGSADGTDSGRAMGSKSLLGLIFEFSRVGRTSKRLPSLASIVHAVVLWLKPGHHPEHDGDVGAAMRYFDAREQHERGRG